jgi:hypothetical protein
MLRSLTAGNMVTTRGIRCTGEHMSFQLDDHEAHLGTKGHQTPCREKLSAFLLHHLSSTIIKTLPL